MCFVDPVVNTFRYPVVFFAFDVDELVRLNTEWSGIFGYNRFALASLWDSDYLTVGQPGLKDASMKEKLWYWLQQRGVEVDSVGR